jgi:hypothetical protein
MSESLSSKDIPGPVGLGGWLAIVGLGLVLAAFRISAFLMQDYLPMFQDGTWETLTTPGGEAYNVVWGPLLVFEIIGNLGFVGASLYLLVLFLNRSRLFPRVYIGYTVANLFFILGDAWLTSFALIDQPIFDEETMGEFLRALVVTLVWVPYMFKSKRVKNTFVE